MLSFLADYKIKPRQPCNGGLFGLKQRLLPDRPVGDYVDGEILFLTTWWTASNWNSTQLLRISVEADNLTTAMFNFNLLVLNFTICRETGVGDLRQIRQLAKPANFLRLEIGK